ncbi:MAG: hypothetical protein NTY80_02655 [candidate division SR1 bacterium]|nr:hypothetical protein [candidate division SR1 bacterium]
MIEQNENTNTLNTNKQGSGEPNFGGMQNLKLNDLENILPSQNIISQLNSAEGNKPQKEDVNFESLGMKIQATEEKGSRVDLGESGLIIGNKSKYHNQYWKLFLISFFIILVTGLASIILRLYSRYIYFASQTLPDTTYQTYIGLYKQGQQFLDKTLNLSDYQQYVSLSLAGSGEDTNITKVIQDKTLGYIQKKDVLQQALNSFSSLFLNNTQKLTSLKEDISKYGFFSQELYDMLQSQDYSTSIKKYLLSLEIIKFSSAIKVFGYLDTFISSLANALHIPADQAQINVQTLADRGEKDIVIYLNNCYLNPYEIDYDCNLVGDFDRYYALIDKEKTPPDTNFFKKVMYYVDTKLEQTDIPSFSITFKKYDPTQKQISFTVDVNTFKQDEIALIKKGIINPHIFILSSLLNLIKQSAFVISEKIDAKSIKITPKIIKIGSSVFNVNNSTMDFVLPIQKSSQREISDYIDPIFTSSP